MQEKKDAAKAEKEVMDAATVAARTEEQRQMALGTYGLLLKRSTSPDSSGHSQRSHSSAASGPQSESPKSK